MCGKPVLQWKKGRENSQQDAYSSLMARAGEGLSLKWSQFSIYILITSTFTDAMYYNIGDAV
jgi:hypothetical protein